MYSVEKTAPVPSKGRGKVGPVKKLEKNHRFHKAFKHLGEEWNLKKYHVLKQLEEFTCLIYEQNRESSMDGLRAKLLRKVVGEDEKLTSKFKIDLAVWSCGASLTNSMVDLLDTGDREEKEEEEEENEDGRV